ncbi:MAG: O-antigen ligase family protein [Armatimonadota bacterium]
MTIPWPDGNGRVRAGWLALLAVAVLAPWVGAMPGGEKYGAEVPLAALRFLAIGAAALSLPGSGPRPTRLGRAFEWAVGGWVAWGALSLLMRSELLTSPVLLFAMVPGFLDMAAMGAVAVAARRFAAARGGTLPLALALVAGLAVCAVAAAQETGINPPGHRASGTFFSPNFAAGFLGLTLPFAAALMLDARHRLVVLGTGAVAALGFGAVVSTGSRSGIAVALAGLGLSLVVAAVRERGRLPWIRVAALLAAFVVTGFAFRNAVLVRTATGGGQEHSRDFRRETVRATARMAEAHPVVGTGPGTFPYVYGKYARVAWTGQAHSTYVQAAAETGVPSLVALVIVLGFALVAGWAGAWRERGSTLGAAIGGALVVGILRGWFDSESIVLGNALPLWIVAGMASAGATAGQTSSRAGWAWWAPWALSWAPVLAGTEGGGWPPSPEQLATAGRYEEAARIEPTARRWFVLARRAESGGDPAAAVGWFRKAVDSDPNSLQTLRALAEAQERAGDPSGALDTWRRLIAVHEGPAGRVRALPELIETWAVAAYAALARDAGRAGDPAAAAGYWNQAKGVLAAYTAMSALYQEAELRQIAGRTPDEQAQRLRARRDELRTLVREMATAGVDATGLIEALDAMDARSEALVRPPTP